MSEIENVEGLQHSPSGKDGKDKDCSECCEIFKDRDTREAFGYCRDLDVCQCHDICVEDVRDIAIEERTLCHCIPCTAGAIAGCRGGLFPDCPCQPVTIAGIRVASANQTLSPSTGCDRINNEVQFEIILNVGSSYLICTPKDEFSIMWYEFAKFPSGIKYCNNPKDLNKFRKELALIDGSSKVIIIEDYELITEGNDCSVRIEYKVINKLWKHENLLVSAIKPYANNNITVSGEFNSGHSIGTAPCIDNTSCIEE